MTTVTMEIPEDMLAAAIQWYAEEWIAQSKAAEFASVSRTKFLDELYGRRISATQVADTEG